MKKKHNKPHLVEVEKMEIYAIYIAISESESSENIEGIMLAIKTLKTHIQEFNRRASQSSHTHAKNFILRCRVRGQTDQDI